MADPSTNADVWLVVPVFNEGQVIREVAAKARETFPNIVCVDDGSSDNSAEEIRARGAKTIVIAEEGDEKVRPFANYLIEIPESSTLLQPLLSTIPLQFLAAEIARQCGNEDIDKPRNLAKSVTVE